MVDIENPQALIAYLRERGAIEDDESPAVSVLPGGVSNRTVKVARASGEAWVLKQALEKLRVKDDWFSSPLRIHREAAGLKWLSRVAPEGAVPRFIFEDEERHILAMEAVAEPHDNWKALLLSGRVDEAIVMQFGALLGTIHRAGFEGRAGGSAAFGDRSFFESLRLEPYYGFAAKNVPAAGPFLSTLIAEARATRESVVHGDYSPKNVLVRGGRIVLLDHEVIHFGDGAFDVGFALTHLLSKAHHLPAIRGLLAEAAGLFWRTYRGTAAEAAAGAGFEPRAVRHTLGCLLGRVAGRSRLEYLGEAERERQRETAVALMGDPPETASGLISRFLGAIAPSGGRAQNIRPPIPP